MLTVPLRSPAFLRESIGRILALCGKVQSWALPAGWLRGRACLGNVRSESDSVKRKRLCFTSERWLAPEACETFKRCGKTGLPPRGFRVSPGAFARRSDAEGGWPSGISSRAGCDEQGPPGAREDVSARAPSAGPALSACCHRGHGRESGLTGTCAGAWGNVPESGVPSLS